MSEITKDKERLFSIFKTQMKHNIQYIDIVYII